MIEQSEFNYTQEVTQPPPETMVAKTPMKPGIRKLYMILGLLGGILILLILVPMVERQRKAPGVMPTISPTAAPSYQEKPKIQIELERLKGLVEEANPVSQPFPPPEVDMKVAF